MRALFVCIKGQGRTHVVALEGRTLCGAEMPDEAAIFRGVPDCPACLAIVRPKTIPPAGTPDETERRGQQSPSVF